MSEQHTDASVSNPRIKVTEIERELLELLMEECSEVIQRASKCVRFGFQDEYECNTNAELLMKEFSQVVALMNLLTKYSSLRAQQVYTTICERELFYERKLDLI